MIKRTLFTVIFVVLLVSSLSLSQETPPQEGGAAMIIIQHVTEDPEGILHRVRDETPVPSVARLKQGRLVRAGDDTALIRYGGELYLVEGLEVLFHAEVA